MGSENSNSSNALGSASSFSCMIDLEGTTGIILIITNLLLLSNTGYFLVEKSEYNVNPGLVMGSSVTDGSSNKATKIQIAVKTKLPRLFISLSYVVFIQKESSMCRLCLHSQLLNTHQVQWNAKGIPPKHHTEVANATFVKAPKAFGSSQSER